MKRFHLDEHLHTLTYTGCICLFSSAGQRCRQSQSGRSLRSIHANEIPTPVGPGGKPGEHTTNTSNISLSQSRESKENREDAPSMETSSTHRLQSDHARVRLVLVPSGLGVNEQVRVCIEYLKKKKKSHFSSVKTFFQVLNSFSSTFRQCWRSLPRELVVVCVHRWQQKLPTL